ncbi:MAG: O-antigen ligase family protein [Lachnospiraceae bacterium]|nr:O-antigen ligase family protein [Lachnospiraceae bacterium]
MNKLGKKNKIRIVDFAFIWYVITIFLYTDKAEKIYISNYAFLFFFILAIFYIFKDKNGKTEILPLIIFLPFVVFSWVTCAFAISVSLAFEKVITLTSLFIMGFLVYNIYDRRDEFFQIIIIAIMLGGFVVALHVVFSEGIYNIIFGIIHGKRVGKNVLQLNYLGRYTAYSAMISFFYAYGLKKYYLYFITIISAVVCVGSQSRQAMFALIVSVFIIWFSTNHYERYYDKILSTIIKLNLVITAVILVLRLPVFSSLTNRIISGISVVTDNGLNSFSDYERLYMIQFGFNVFLEHPFLGIGLGNVREVVTGIISKYGYLHNNYIELLACGGIIGFFSYYGIYFKIFKDIKTDKSDKFKNLVIAILISSLVLDFFAVTYYSKIQWLLFIFIFLSGNANREKTIEKYINNTD